MANFTKIPHVDQKSLSRNISYIFYSNLAVTDTISIAYVTTVSSYMTYILGTTTAPVVQW